jgi:L-amino acid N-acyltransferase YncA
VTVATGIELRDLRPDDWPEVARIFEEGIRAGATFATKPTTWEIWDERHSLRVVAESEGDVLGWAALTPVSPRHVYRGVAESSVYVAEAARGRGIGRALMQELIDRAERQGIWTIEASMFPENEASLELHRALGFRVVGTRERIGQHRDGMWRDTVLLERRSKGDLR